MDEQFGNDKKVQEWLALGLGLALAVILLLFMCTGCAHIRYGEVEYWRLGRQEIEELQIVAPDGTTVILRGCKSGENVKPSVREFFGE